MVSDPNPRPKKRWRDRVASRLLALDAWIDTTVWSGGILFSRFFEIYGSIMRRFEARGIKRIVSEVGSESFTLGTVGAVVMLAFAQPAFEETRDGWQATADYSVTFLDRNGKEIGKRGMMLDDSVPLDELPDYLIKAALATEDRRFFDHFGIDVFGTLRALVENARAGSVVQGGSSITQQLAKNLFLSNERTLERKIKEAFLAIWLEANMTKRQILKLYLDRAYMGGGVFGVGAASEYYFGKSVKDLTLAESAMLAGLFKAPSKYSPTNDLPAARARANEVLTNMVQAGFLTEGQVIGARRNPAVVVDRTKQDLPDYFLDWAFEEIKKLAPGPDHVLTAKTTIDMDLQKKAEEAVESSLRQYGRNYGVTQAALASVELDGAVRAMVGGRDYGASQFNRAADALRQPGSSFKPFVYMTAFMNGYEPMDTITDGPVTIGHWSPRNYGRGYRGRVTLTEALVRSINTIPVKLSLKLGRAKIIETAYRMGISHELHNTMSLPLGTSEVTPLDMAGAYAVFANGGRLAKPYPATEIYNSQGKLVWSHDRDGTKSRQVLPRDKVVEMTNILNQVVDRGTGRRARIEGVRAAGKTGTTQAYRDAWFVGFTGNYCTAVWFGNDDFSGTNRMTGGSLPAMTWQDYMSYAHANIKLKPIAGFEDVDGDGTPRDATIATADDGAQGAAQAYALPAKTRIVLNEIQHLFDAEATASSAPDGTKPTDGSRPFSSSQASHETLTLAADQRGNAPLPGRAD